MGKKASNGAYFKERISILTYFISLGFLTENDVEEAYKNSNLLWDERISSIEQKYRTFSICYIFNDRIGELIPRYIHAVDNEKKLPKDEMEAFIGVRGWCNQKLKKILERHITIIDFTDKFWIYFILTYSGTINLEDMDKYSDREEYERNNCIPEQTAKLFELTGDELQYSTDKVKKIGIKEPFICFSNRDSAYLDTLYPQGDWTYHNYRDSHIENYELMTKTLKEKNIATVRMGKAVEHRTNFENCIDFASDYYDEMLDIYLMSKCKFFVGDESGINVLPRALNKPVVTANLVTVTGYGGIPLREDNLFIFKKFYDTNTNKLLNFKEMCRVLQECRYDTAEFDKKGIRLIENTPEEIRDVVIEMNDYIDGNVIHDEEGEYLQEKADDILGEQFKKLEFGSDEIMIGKIGRTFLKNNRYLLE